MDSRGQVRTGPVKRTSEAPSSRNRAIQNRKNKTQKRQTTSRKAAAAAAAAAATAAAATAAAEAAAAPARAEAAAEAENDEDMVGSQAPAAVAAAAAAAAAAPAAIVPSHAPAAIVPSHAPANDDENMLGAETTVAAAERERLAAEKAVSADAAADERERQEAEAAEAAARAAASRTHLEGRESHMTHPASQTAARSLRYSIFVAIRQARQAGQLNAQFNVDVDLDTHLNTSLSDLARILFGETILQLFSKAHRHFTPRELFEFASVPSQCKGTIGLPTYGKDECWICGLPLDKNKYGMYNECEHVLPVAQAAYFLALYGPEYINLKKEYTKLKKQGSIITPEMEGKKQMYDVIFNHEYAHSHAACNRKKNDMCGISGKLNIDSTGKKTPYAVVNEASIRKLLTDIYNDENTLFSVLRPEIHNTYKTEKDFIDKRYLIFEKKYLNICKFLNQCESFNGSTYINDKNCLYKFNALCIAGAGAAVKGVTGSKKILLDKYTEDANAFRGDKNYLTFLGDIYNTYQNLFIKTYKKLKTICDKYDPTFFSSLYKLPEIIRDESFSYIAHEYFRIASSIPQFIYLEKLIDIYNKKSYDLYIDHIAQILIGIFLRERCNMIASNIAQLNVSSDMKKDLNTEFVIPYKTFFGKTSEENIINDLLNTQMYMGIEHEYNNRYTYGIDNIIILRLTANPSSASSISGGTKSKQKLYTTRGTNKHTVYNFKGQSMLTQQSKKNIQRIERDERAKRRAKEREQRYNEQMLIGINAIITDAITETANLHAQKYSIVPENVITYESVLEDFENINKILGTVQEPPIVNIKGGGINYSRKRYIKTRKYRKARK